MPMYNYVCDKCNTSKSFLDNREVAPESRGRCKKCSTGMMISATPKPAGGVYTCDKCGDDREYFVTTAHNLQKLPDDLICEKCKEGNLVRDFVKSAEGQNFDMPGAGSYIYEYGKKAFHRMPPSEYAKIISGEKDPY